MKIVIIGYGKMGRAVEKVALAKGIEIVACVDSEDDWAANIDKIKFADVAIEFSTPQTVASNLHRCFDIDLPVVTGTTAWEHKLPQIKSRCISESKSLLVAPNFSIGMNIFFKLNKYLAGVMDKFEQFEPVIEEIHHKKKLDQPSGTAKHLAESMINIINRLDQWKPGNEMSGGILPVISHRTDDVPGIHKISYASEEDLIEIQHTAKSRAGFAQGAVIAAEWIVGRTGFFTMDNLLADII